MTSRTNTRDAIGQIITDVMLDQRIILHRSHDAGHEIFDVYDNAMRNMLEVAPGMILDLLEHRGVVTA